MSEYRDGNVVRNKYGEDVSNYYKEPKKGSGGGSGGGGAAGLIMLFFMLLAAIVFVASNIVYIIILGGIYIAGMIINRKLKNNGKSLLIRIPIILVTWILLLAGLIFSFYDKAYGIVPVLRSDVVIGTEGNIYKSPVLLDNPIGSLIQGEKISILASARNEWFLKITTSNGL